MSTRFGKAVRSGTSWPLAILLCLSMCPVSVFAEGGPDGGQQAVVETNSDNRGRTSSITMDVKSAEGMRSAAAAPYAAVPEMYISNGRLVIGTESYDLGSFSNLGRWITSATAVTPSGSKNLHSGSTVTVSVYEGFTINMKCKIDPVRADGSVEHLYAWKFGGITCERPYSGELSNETGVLGYYYISQDGYVYFVFNNSIDELFYIDAAVSFSGRWDTSGNGNSVILDFGDGVKTTLMFDKTRGNLSKTAVYSAGVGKLSYSLKLTAYDVLSVNKIHDVLSNTLTTTSTLRYLNDFVAKYGPLHDHMRVTNVKWTCTDGRSGTIPDDKVVASSGGSLASAYDIDLSGSAIQVPTGKTLTITYDVVMSTELMYARAIANGTLQFRNAAEVTLDDGSKLNAAAGSMSVSGATPLSKYGSSYYSTEGRKVFELTIRNPGFGDHAMVTDTLSSLFPDLDYVDHTSNSFYSSKGVMNYRPEFYMCSSQAEFDGLAWNSPGAQDANGRSRFCIYGKSFKFFLPGEEEWMKDSTWTLKYSVKWTDEIQGEYVSAGSRPNYANTASFSYYDYQFDINPYVPPVNPPVDPGPGVIGTPPTIKKTSGEHYLDYNGNLCMDWVVTADVPADVDRTRFYLTDNLTSYYVSVNGVSTLHSDVLLLKSALDAYKKSENIVSDPVHFNSVAEFEAVTGMSLSVTLADGTDYTEFLATGPSSTREGINVWCSSKTSFSLALYGPDVPESNNSS